LTPEPGFKVCYRHPRKVAVQNCKLCGRPICVQCGQESGDPLFCMPCKQDTMLHGDRLLEEGRDKKPGQQPEARQTPIEVGEVTVFDDGTVVRPGEPTTPPTITYQPEEEADLPAVPPLALTEQGTEDLFLREPTTEETAPADDTAVKSGVFTAEKSVMGRPQRTGVFSQMLYAMRYGVGIAVLVMGAWLLIAWGAKQWTQISVFTMGLAVPWAIYNATTRKRYLGLRVWLEPPPIIFMSTASFIIVMAFTLLMEYLARLLIFGTRFPVSDFSQRYFKASDWVIIVCGLALAALTPFLLKFGSELSTPSLRRKSKAPDKTGDEEAGRLEQELGEELNQKSGDGLDQQLDDEPALKPLDESGSPAGEEPENKYWA
jgi:hypothetical protein